MATLTVFIHGIGSNNKAWEAFIKAMKFDNQTNKINEYILNSPIEDENMYYYLYEYNSKILKISSLIDFIRKARTGRKDDGNISIASHVGEFKSTFSTQFKIFNEINIIAHSMGGIIVTNLLFDLFETKNKNLINKINNIIYYATPLKGSHEPNTLEEAGFGYYLPSQILEELKPGSPTIKKLNRNIKKYSNDIQENFNLLYIKGIADSRIVTLNYDYFNGFGNFDSVKGGHSDIIKPSSHTEPSFTLFRDFILAKGKKIPTKKQLIERNNNYHDYFEKCTTKIERAEYTSKDNSTLNYYCSNIFKELSDDLDKDKEYDDSSIKIFVNIFQQCFDVHISTKNLSEMYKLDIEPNPYKKNQEHYYDNKDVTNLFFTEYYEYPEIKYGKYANDHVNMNSLVKPNGIDSRIENDLKQDGRANYVF